MKLSRSLCTTLLVLALTNSLLQAAPTTIRVGCTYWLPNVPLDIAQAKGWWAEADLDVKISHFETSREVITGLNDGSFDLATDMIGSWVDSINTGSDLVILGETDWSHGGDKIVVKDGVEMSPSTTGFVAVYINNLAVKRFAAEYLKTKNLILADFRFVEIEDDDKLVEAFAAGKIKAAISYEPLVSQLIAAQGVRVVSTTADFPGVMPEGFAARGDFFRKVPKEGLVRFFRVWLKAVAYAQDPANAGEVAQIASSQTFAGNETFDPAKLAESLAEVPMHAAARAAAENGVDGNLQKFMRKAATDLKVLNQLKDAEELKKAVDTSALLQAATQG